MNLMKITAALVLTMMSTKAFADVSLNREPQQISFNQMINDNNSELQDIRAQFKASIQKADPQDAPGEVEEAPSLLDTAAN